MLSGTDAPSCASVAGFGLDRSFGKTVPKLEARCEAPVAYHSRSMERRFYIETYGCQMNVADSELMLGQLGRAGYRRVERAEEADVILVNTCAIREHAEQRIYGRLGELTRHKLRRPGVVLGVAGCMAQHLRGKLMERVPQVDLVVGPDGYRRLPELIDEAREEPTLAVRLSRVETYGDLVPARADGVRAWVSIMRGCDKFCTFCIVPYVRGRERSLPADEVLRQVEHAAAEGFREIVFLGQTVNAYRDGDVDFAELLIRADRVPGIARIRFTSPHPSDMTDRAIDAMARCEKVPPHLHLPLQSGSDAVLSRMRRIYSIDEYERLVERIRRAIPGIALSTDIIVGFPGETEEDFETTRRAMDRIGYESAFIFKYSPRSGALFGRSWQFGPARARPNGPRRWTRRRRRAASRCSSRSRRNDRFSRTNRTSDPSSRCWSRARRSGTLPSGSGSPRSSRRPCSRTAGRESGRSFRSASPRRRRTRFSGRAYGRPRSRPWKTF